MIQPGEIARRVEPGRLLRQLVLLPIRLYQWVVSPLLPPACRYQPTCSAYAIEAIGRHGLIAGGWMTLRRLLRCHPWGGSGFDPVPAPGLHHHTHHPSCHPLDRA
jgi:putative membrane protein insertion efficiency factor